MAINVLHISEGSDPDDVQQFLRDNIANVNVVRLSTDSLIDEMIASGIIETEDLNSIITIRKVSNRLFNNEVIKKKSPISSPEFVTGISEELISQGINNSYLSLLYMHSVPVFVNDIGRCNYLFGGSINNDIPLMSSDKDWHLYRKILKNYKFNIYVFGEYEIESIVELASLGIEYPNYELCGTEDVIEEDYDEESDKFDYDFMMVKEYG